MNAQWKTRKSKVLELLLGIMHSLDFSDCPKFKKKLKSTLFWGQD